MQHIKVSVYKKKCNLALVQWYTVTVDITLQLMYCTVALVHNVSVDITDIMKE